MDLEGTKFGSGPRELGGSVDLINRYKLWPHHEFFCKRSLPSSISETKYLNNVVGDKEIRKGEGMELDQLFQNNPCLKERKAPIHPLDLNLLKEAFQIRDTTFVNHSFTEKGYLTAVLAKSKSESKHKKRKHKRHRDKETDHKKHKRRKKEKIHLKNQISNGNHFPPPEQLKNNKPLKDHALASLVMTGSNNLNMLLRKDPKTGTGTGTMLTCRERT